MEKALLRGLREAVLQLRAEHRGTRFPASVSLGRPGGERTRWEIEPGSALDHGLRVEVVGALLVRAGQEQEAPVAWLTRPGELSWHDRDAEWLPACAAAYAEAGRPLTFVVVTKRGWYDPRSGARREWKRLRGPR